MKGLVLSLFLISCSTSVYAKPGLAYGGGDFGSYGGNNGGSAQIQLMGVPDINSYNGIHYPNFDILDLGTSQHGLIPPKIVKISSTVAIKIPKPYPVKIPHNVPYPVHVDKPYPVPVTHLVKVPHPVPVEVIKKVPVPVEVPKPYPVPHNEYSQLHGSGGSGGSGGWIAGPNVNYNEQQQALSSGGIDQSSEGFDGTSGYGNSNYNQDSYGQGYQGQDDNSSKYPEVVSSNSYEVKQGQDESS